ncbi:MAG: hypothetical protein HY458_01025 [Parcubacteria group bacterium]|nr:hypothetical protein [Parcubacteria group bacterium]
MIGRTILLNCCENWILQWGKFYEDGKEFVCLPNSHPWRKEKRNRYTNLASSIVWTVDSLKGYPFLKPEGSTTPPVLKRCCSEILIKHGSEIPERCLPLQFECPVCEAFCSVELEKVHGLFVRLYTTHANNNSETFRLREEATPPFLEPVFEPAPVA